MNNSIIKMSVCGLSAIIALFAANPSFASCTPAAAQKYAATDDVQSDARILESGLKFRFPGKQIAVRATNVKVGSFTMNQDIMVYTTYTLEVSGTGSTIEDGSRSNVTRSVFDVNGNCMPKMGDGVTLSPSKY